MIKLTVIIIYARDAHTCVSPRAPFARYEAVFPGPINVCVGFLVKRISREASKGVT